MNYIFNADCAEKMRDLAPKQQGVNTMTVAELIEKLKNFPGDSTVVTSDTSATYSDSVSVSFTDRYPEYRFGNSKIVFIEGGHVK